MKIPKKIFRSRLSVGIALVILVMVFSVGSLVVVSQYKENSIEAFNDEVKLFAKLSTSAIVQNFELYHDSGSLKFDEATDEITGQKAMIERFLVVDTEGLVLHDSKEEDHDSEVILAEKIEELRSLEASYVYSENGRIESVLYPHIEDWGAHKYSVKFDISPEELNQDIARYRNEVIFASALLFLLSFIPIFGVFSLREYEHQREDKKRFQLLNKQKDNFMTLVAHNLRTPISIMKGYANLAEEKSLSKLEGEYVNAIIEGTERLSGVTETIIRVNEILSGMKIPKRKENLEDVVASVLEKYKVHIKKKKLSVEFHKDDNLEKINLNREYMEKAISSLIDNAIKFNKTNGKIIVSIKRKGGNVVFSVKDTGIGIKKEDQKTIFTSFHRAVEDVLNYDYSGLGMGLYLTKVIVEAHGGKVWLESEKDKGSTFSFSLPLNG